MKAALPRFGGEKYGTDQTKETRTKSGKTYVPTPRRNKRDVWTVGTSGFRGARLLVFPEKLIEPCILAGGHWAARSWIRSPGAAPPGGGQTPAARFHRREINPDYAQMATEEYSTRRKEDNVEITVKMTVEFQRFAAWQKEQDYYEKELDKELDKREIRLKKTCWAIDADPRSPARSRSLTRNTRRNCWKWPRITWHKKKSHLRPVLSTRRRWQY